LTPTIVLHCRPGHAEASLQRQLQRGTAGLARAIAIEALALTSSVAGGAQVRFSALISLHNQLRNLCQDLI